MGESVIAIKNLEKLIKANDFKKVFDKLRFFVSNNIVGRDLTSLMIRNEFRSLQSEFITYDIQQKKGTNKEELASLRESLKAKLLIFLNKLEA